jgi:hypothetical protein
MSSQHSDDQTARSRPLTARQSRCRSPFTRAGSRLPAQTPPFLSDTTASPQPHRSRPARPSRRAKAAQQPRTTRASNRDTTEKAPRAAGSPIAQVRISESPTSPAARRAPDFALCLVPHHGSEHCGPPPCRRLAAPPVAVPAPGPAPCRPHPDRSQRPAVQIMAMTFPRLPLPPPPRGRLFPVSGFREAAEKTLPRRRLPDSCRTAIHCAAQPDAPPPLGPVVDPRLCLQWLAVRFFTFRCQIETTGSEEKLCYMNRSPHRTPR